MASKFGFSVEFTAFGVSFHATGTFYPADSGNLSGHPDSWTPPEAEDVDVISLTCNEADAMFLLESTLAPAVHTALLTQLQVECYEPSEPDERWDEPSDGPH